MSDEIKHKCGIALVRLKKPLEYYHLKYGTGDMVSRNCIS